MSAFEEAVRSKLTEVMEHRSKMEVNGPATSRETEVVDGDERFTVCVYVRRIK